MAKIYTITIKNDKRVIKPDGLANAKRGDHILFVGPEKFTVTINGENGESPFHAHTFTQDYPCAGPLLVPLRGKEYWLVLQVEGISWERIGPHPIPIP